MYDTISRIICDTLNIRIYTVNSLNSVKEITEIHQTTPNATVALGRTVSAAGLLSATLKPESDQTISIKFSGSGPLKELYVQCDAKGNVRGYVSQPDIDYVVDLGSINFSKAIGAGFLTVVKDLGIREPYSSTIPLSYGNIAEDVTYYLTVSEQVPSAMLLGLELDHDGRVVSSGGILIQTFPDTTDSTVSMLEENIKSLNSLRSIDETLGQSLARDKNIYDIVSEIVNNEPLSIHEEYHLKSACRCNRKMLEKTLSSLSVDELTDMIEKDNGAEVTCTFCRQTYLFTAKDLYAIKDSN